MALSPSPAIAPSTASPQTEILQSLAVAQRADEALRVYRKVAAQQVIETQRVPAKTTPQTFYITAIHPDRPVDQIERLTILMENEWEDEDALINLVTNASGFLEVMQAVRQHPEFQNKRWCFRESWGEGESPF
ncbi:MAG: hypothetical protein KME27_10955 [Lyngbya sp. HA4199-MV5]|nr:hypothetical protein [Lyngbya sp. HA4199-MV5]